MTATILLVRRTAHVEVGDEPSGRRRDAALGAEGIEPPATLDRPLRFDVDPASAARPAPGSRGFRINSINERLYR
jgi:hypothetical protein